MFIIAPYRVKNPWKKFPIATLSLIGINVLVYLLTTESGLFIREDVITGYAYQLGGPIINIIWAMFLHGNILHLAGNMLFLWVFSPPVEDRLGIPKFLLIYFATGIVGFLLQGVMDLTMADMVRPGIGASGAIMGVMGAYWYIFSWSIVCVFYWIFWFWRGVWEIKAIWVIGAYIVLDLIQAIMGASDGVANFAHVGGGVAGALLCLGLRIKRDTAAVSEVKATQAEMKDLSLVPLLDLEVMRKDDPLNTDVLRAMIPQACRMGRTDILQRIFNGGGTALIEKDPALVVHYLLKLHGDDSIYSPTQLMRLARFAEGTTDSARAALLYEMVLEHHPMAQETEMALYRLACYHWDKHHDAQRAGAYLTRQLERYPFGSLEQPAKMMLQKMK